MAYSETDKLKALAIVNVFETSRAFGDYTAVAVLNDGAGISYGINQFTHRSGSLATVLEVYLASAGILGRSVIERNLKLAKTKSAKAIAALAADEIFKKALTAAGASREMKDAQRQVAFDRYLRPAVLECERFGFMMPLSLAVIYDSITHGSWKKLRLSANLNAPHATAGGPEVSAAWETDWITKYVGKRDAWLASIPRLAATRYRTRFFLNQIAILNWELRLPLNVNGVRISSVPTNSAVEPAFNTHSSQPEIPPNTSHTDRMQTSAACPDPQPQAQPPDLREEKEIGIKGVGETCLDEIQARVDQAAAKYDQVEEIVETVITRKDAGKSLWTTVVGSVSQAVWALFGLLAGVPREVWLVVALIAAALMLAYLYRQIALGKIREGKRYGFSREDQA